MALNTLVDSFLPESKNVGIKGLTLRAYSLLQCRCMHIAPDASTRAHCACYRDKGDSFICHSKRNAPSGRKNKKVRFIC